MEADEKRNVGSGRVKRPVLVSRLGQWLEEAADKRKAYCGSWLKAVPSTTMRKAECLHRAALAKQPGNLLAST